MPVFDAVTALVQTILDAISLIGENARAEQCDTNHKQRDEGLVPNFPVFHDGTPCIHMIWPLLPSQRDPAAMVDSVIWESLAYR
jgi:hypothetical protein